MNTTPSIHTEPYIHYPLESHTHTLILLHGTSSTGPELASDLLSFQFAYPHPPPPSDPSVHTPLPSPSMPSSKQTHPQQTHTLASLLPTTKFVFPTGSLKPVTVFGGRLMHAWFDIHSFADRTVGEEVQREGMRESAVYLSGLVDQERGILAGEAGRGDGGDEDEARKRGEEGSRVAVLGFSQGCAMGVMMVLGGMFDEPEIGTEKSHGKRTVAYEEERFGGERGVVPFIGLSGWLPFRFQIDAILSPNSNTGVRSYIRSLLQLPPSPTPSRIGREQHIYFAHGALDTKVTLEWATQMVETLRSVDKIEKGKEEGAGIGLKLDIEAKVYGGLGHWFNSEELCGVIDFLKRIWSLDTDELNSKN